MSVVEWTDTDGIYHQKILWSSYRKLAWAGIETTTTELHSDALTDWAIRPWVQLTLRANFVQLLQFHSLFSVRFHFGFAFVSCHIYFNRNILYIYICIHTVITISCTISKMADKVISWAKVQVFISTKIQCITEEINISTSTIHPTNPVDSTRPKIYM